MNSFEKHLDNALSFIHDYQELVDCHLVDFITNNLWEKCLPRALRNELENLEGKRIDLSETAIDSGELYEIVRKVDALNLKNNARVLQCSDIPSFLPHVNIEWKDIVGKNITHDFMKEKKSYEISVLSKVIGYLSKANSSLVIDVGAGKGYLATSLSQNYGIPVLAIDSNESRHKSAIRRQELMKKKKHQTFPLVQHSIRFIDDNTDYAQLVHSFFPDYNGNKNFLLAGLHTCGPLAHFMIKSFINSNYLNTLCVVSCCYHLTEESLTGKCFFSKNARMLAQQSVERASEKKDSQSVSLFYRAVLQILLQSFGIGNARIGRGAPLDDFPSYAQWALMKIGLKSEQIPSNQELRILYETHVHEKWKMDCFQALRIYLGSVVEAAIILDRIIYLERSGNCSKLSIIRLFDPLLSPRCYAIVALK